MVRLSQKLLPDAERGEDAIQDIVGGGRAGDRVDGPQRGIKIQQQHLVRDAAGSRVARLLQRFARFLQ